MSAPDPHPTPQLLRLDLGPDAPAGRLASLYDWLGEEEGLRGGVRPRGAPPGRAQMGAAPDVITVAVGSAGVAGVLARSLPRWYVRMRDFGLDPVLPREAVRQFGPDRYRTNSQLLDLDPRLASDQV